MWIISRVFGESRWTRAIFCLSVIQAVLAIVFEAVIFQSHQTEIAGIERLLSSEKNLEDSLGTVQANARSLLVYFILFMLAQVFTVVLVVDAIYQKNTIQLIALVAFELGMTAYSVIQYHQSATLFNPLEASGKLVIDYLGTSYHASKWAEITQICVMIVCSMIFVFLAYKLYLEFGWHIYKKIGADLAMRDRYKMYQIFMMLLKFDFFFFLGFSVQYLVLMVVAWWPEATTDDKWRVLIQQLVEHIILSCVFSIAMIISAFWGLIRERKIPMYAFILLSLASMGYFIYMVTQVAMYPSKYLGSRVFLTFFLCVDMALILVSVPVSVICLRNFNHGLNSHITHATAASGSNHNMTTIGHEKPESRRWSIE
ncbi:hypothetical protein PHYBLDRAFT_183506 [Phycomyces blakesleeanus NRRL 1555(-)]|uniref:Uncharacterized protein n=2 Tax=Phycomyces blakesleeanus TaxID=4837 RepID=A0A167K7Z8_PHYB8|nr:hypothetical protein PHYBLDRAFT_183506 [Phycomyces blakesleeanus NRRL 1555(-)]OAD67448.1 hypothetical protein PHYBLDRAFT_183506 [Phycomyces blakesleeanus NRRL 1555(-)]|eukprot:XP_018285488.1 hypothetical protein PHYBLDRAFT_183506 [Phycomyces blakesleeanus NRRL 1555(-)]